MRNMAVFGRNLRVYYLFAGMVVATLALVLVMAFADAKPAHAEGEAWYGTIEWTEGGPQQTLSDGTLYTKRASFRWEAPYTTDQARLVYDYYDQKLRPYQGGCSVVEETVTASGTIDGAEVQVTPPPSYNPNVYNVVVRANPNYTATPIPATRTIRYEGYYSTGVSCARTETVSTAFNTGGQFWFKDPNGTTSQRCEFDGAGLPYPVTWSRGCHAGLNNYNFNATNQTVRYALAQDPCSGYSRRWDIGKDDSLFLFNTCQAKSLNARTSFLDDISGRPKVCAVNFVKRLSQACTVYKAVLREEWATLDWFLYNAARWDACGVWVVDGASWRPPKIKSATRDSDGQGIPWISPGTTEHVRTATGSVPVTCPG